MSKEFLKAVGILLSMSILAAVGIALLVAESPLAFVVVACMALLLYFAYTRQWIEGA